MAVRQNDSKRAQKQYKALAPTVGDFPLFCEEAIISVERLLGLLADTFGSLDNAADHFESAAGFCRDAGYTTELAWCLSDYADLLLKRNSEGDRQKANARLSECLDISRELGVRPLRERVLSRREILKA